MERPQEGSGVQNTYLRLSPVLKRTQQVQKEVIQLNEKGEWGSTWSASCLSTISPPSAKTLTSPFFLGLPVMQGLGQARHDLDFIRGEMFRQMKAVLAGNGKEWGRGGEREGLCSRHSTCNSGGASGKWLSEGHPDANGSSDLFRKFK